MYHIWDKNFEFGPKCPTCEDHMSLLLEQINRYTYHIWGEDFYNRQDIANHPNCEVCFVNLTLRLKAGIPLEEAVLSSKKIICWGESFFSFTELSRDPRCHVHFDTLRIRLKEGMAPEQACSKWPIGLEEF